MRAPTMAKPCIATRCPPLNARALAHSAARMSSTKMTVLASLLVQNGRPTTTAIPETVASVVKSVPAISFAGSFWMPLSESAEGVKFFTTVRFGSRVQMAKKITQ